MDELVKIGVIGAIVLMAHLLEGITGFGCTVIALPFITLLLGIKMTVPLLCILGWFMAAYIVVRSWRSIQWKEFAFIAVCAGCGMPVGMLLFERMSPVALCLLLGVFMVGVGIRGCISTWQSHKHGAGGVPAGKSWLMRLTLFCGGIIHGAFGTGGPFVVIYAAKALPEKSLFRVTLSLLWLTLNSCRIVNWTVTGKIFNAELGRILMWLLPFMIAGVLAGDYLHRKVSEYWFRLCVYGVLLIAGVVMLGSNMRKLM